MIEYTPYFDENFTKLIDKTKIKTIIELGARYGDEAIGLSEHYPEATIHAFECNPYVLPQTRNNLSNKEKIILHEVAVSNISTESLFFPADENNPGASSLFKANLGKHWGDLPPVKIKTTRLDEYLEQNNIFSVDMICADIQGGELNAFIGMGKYLDNVKYIITEMPKDDATYFGAPNKKDIIKFLNKNKFIECISKFANEFESDVLFTRIDK